MAVGIDTRQTAACVREHGKGSKCRLPAHRIYSAWVPLPNQRKKRRSFPTLDAAKHWRIAELNRSQVQRRTPTVGFPTLRDAALQWLDDAEDGKILSRHHRPFKPHTLRDYRSAIERIIVPELGAHRLNEISADALQALVDELVGSGMAGSTVNNVIAPIQSLYRRYKRKLVDPTDGLELPQRKGGTRDAITPRQAADLIDALVDDDAALWATAFYTGCRSGELQALTVASVDFDACSVTVTHGWDARVGRIAPKSEAGDRPIPLPATLAEVLREHIERTGRTGSDLVFGRSPTEPWTHSWMLRRARTAWAAVAVGAFLRGERGDLKPVTPHVCRHSYSSWLDAAGISASRADRYMGHSRGSVAERYRHALEGQLREDASRLDEYLRGAQAGKIVSLAATG